MFAIIILFTADIFSLLIYRSTLHSALQPVATSACLSQSCSGYGMRVTKFLHNVAITECKKTCDSETCQVEGKNQYHYHAHYHPKLISYQHNTHGFDRHDSSIHLYKPVMSMLNLNG